VFRAPRPLFFVLNWAEDTEEDGGHGEYTSSVGSDWRSISIDRGDHGLRLDRVLMRHLRDEKGASRNRIQKWIDAGDVLINGSRAARTAWRVQPGDEIRVRVALIPPRSRPKAEPLAIDVLYEDDDLLAVNKPPGLVVHPSYRNTSGTLMNGLLACAQSWPAGSTPALLGRLDKNTSGLVLVTKRASVYTALQRAMSANQIEKDYIAIVCGKPSPPKGTIDLALDRDPWDRRRITVTDRGGQPSVTKYERLATTNTHSSVRCRLITGRTHQIRVHLAAKGWPIVGDATYGRASSFPRQALHAWRLRFKHPLTAKEMLIQAALPDDMRALVAELGLPA
jgi:23S rRNA pseudouridine1911/1915/1917 synthase